MAQPASPFTLDQLIALLDQVEMPYTRQEHDSVLVEVCNRGVTHELRIAALPEDGFCALFQHNLVVCSPELVGADRIAELCRFAMLLNHMLVFGSYRIGGRHANVLEFGAAIPTAGVLLSAEQLEQAVGTLCSSIDDTYPFLQQVLWGGVSADEALARFHAYLHDGTGRRLVADPGGDVEVGDQPELSGAMSELDLDAIDDVFLESLDEGDPFSSAAAEAIVHLRDVQHGRSGGTETDS